MLYLELFVVFINSVVGSCGLADLLVKIYHKIFSKKSQKLIICIGSLLILVFITFNIIIKINDYNKPIYITEESSQSPTDIVEGYNEEEIVLDDDYFETVNDMRDETFYSDAKLCKEYKSLKSLLMYTFSFVTVFACLFILRRKKLAFKMILVTMAIIIVAYNLIAILFITPIKSPVLYAFNIPIYENVVRTTLEDNYKYTTTTTPVKLGQVTTIQYFGEIKYYRGFMEVLILSDSFILVILILYFIERFCIQNKISPQHLKSKK